MKLTIERVTGGADGAFFVLSNAKEVIRVAAFKIEAPEGDPYSEKDQLAKLKSLAESMINPTREVVFTLEK